MVYTKTITLLNEYDGTYYPTVFKNISVKRKTISTVSDKGLIAVDTCVIRIPINAPRKEYLPYKKWLQCSTKSDYWTINTESKDYIVEDEISSVESITSICKNYDAMRVYGFSDNRQGNLSHWRIDAK